MENPYSDDVSIFSVIFTRAIIAWNQAEDSARVILSSLSKGGVGAYAAIIHLGSNGLKDAMLTLADSMKMSETPDHPALADHISHFVSGMDIIRGYRTFYVHSLMSIGKKPGDEDVFQGHLMAREAKGRLAWVHHELSTRELSEFARHCHQIQAYGAAIADQVSTRNAFMPVEPRRPVSSLKKPGWPRVVTKTRHYLTGPQSRLGS